MPHEVQAVDWDAVYWQQSPRLFNFFRYRTGDSDHAQDLTARTMLKAWRYRHSYSSDLGKFEAWLFQIARREIADFFKAFQREPLPLTDDYHADFSLELAFQEREESERLYQLLIQLPTREQDLIALKYGAELTNRAIATILEMSESNVGTSLHRTILKLRNQWELCYA